MEAHDEFNKALVRVLTVATQQEREAIARKLGVLCSLLPDEHKAAIRAAFNRAIIVGDNVP
jgi:hypothetical protein